MGIGLRIVAPLVGFTLTLPALAQLQLLHPYGPIPSFDVTTVKRASGQGGLTVKDYIQLAYGIPRTSEARIAGGPAWISTDHYVIQGKTTDALRDAMEQMTAEVRLNQTHMLQQSLLADRFKLKVHFEMKEMPVYELVPAKSGLKIEAIPTPLAPGNLRMQTTAGKTVMNGNAISMEVLVRSLMNLLEIDGRPIVDKTGFTGTFNVVKMQWAGGLSLPSGPILGADPADIGIGSVFTVLQERLGLRLQPGRAPVEVLVIDSVERPSEN